MFKKKLTFLFSILFFLSMTFISAYDSELVMSCGGTDLELLVPCIAGDSQLNTFAGFDFVAPYLSILYPTEGLTLASNESIPLNFSAVDSSGLASCTYNVLYEGVFYAVLNTSTSCSANTTFNVPISGNYAIRLYAEDNLGNMNLSIRNFAVSLQNPAVNLNTPLNNSYNQGNNTNFSFTATDSDGIDNCKLLSNFTGTWTTNETFNSVTSGIPVTTLKNFTEDYYIWNANCTDTTGRYSTSSQNYSFFTDLTNPFINITTANNTDVSGFQITINYNITDDRAVGSSCYFTLRNSTGDLHNYGENTSLSCTSTSRDFSVLNIGTYNLRIYATDQAGNLNSSTIYFTSSTPVAAGGAGGIQSAKDEVNVLIFNQVNLSKSYSDLDRARAYSDFFITCESKYHNQICNLKQNEFDFICQNIGKHIQATGADCMTFYKLYLGDNTKNVKVSRDLADQYNLIKLIKGEKVLLELTPQIIDPFWLGKNGVFNITVFANKPLKSCSSFNTGKSYEFSCNLTSNTTALITLKDTENSFSKVYEGVISYTQEAGGVTSYQNARVRLINWYYVVAFGFIAGQVFLGGLVLIVFGFYGFVLRKVRFSFKPIKDLKNVVKLKKRQ